MTSRFSALSREELALVVPELLMVGQLIDRAGMAWCISEFGRDEMQQIAIEEWAAASPIYTRRMQHALGYAPTVDGAGDVATIFKGLQLDIGAPPQFLDFRFTVEDAAHGTFQLDHCGALADVEPMGEDFVRGMCHDIEDPTFDATALATNPHAQVRPIHRPPRAPGSTGPICAWTVIIDESYPEPAPVPALAVNQRSQAATLELDPIDPADPGVSDYSGPLLSDIDFTAFSKSALVRMADEICLQMALLDNSFALALAARANPEVVAGIRRKQAVGFAGIAAYRLARALALPHDEAGALRLLAVHPILNPAAYVQVDFDERGLVVHPSPAHIDGAWISLGGGGGVAALEAALQALDPHLGLSFEAAAAGRLHLRIVTNAEPAPEASEVAVAKFSTGADFTFEPRRSLPLTVL